MDNSDKVIATIHKKVSTLTVDDIAMYCQENGVTVGGLCYKLNELLGAKKARYDRDGEWIGEDADHIIQLKALTVALELLKLVGGKDVKISGVVEHKTLPSEDVSKIQEIVKELARLKEEKLLDPIQQGIEDAHIRVV